MPCVPIEGDPAAVFDQLDACADRDPATVCPLPVEQQPGGGDPVACDSTNPETYGQCFADCTDQDVTTACPLPVEGDPAVPEELQAVLDQLNDCADRDPATVCPLPVEQQPGGGDPVACDSTNPETYGQCFADCTDQDVTTACPLPLERDPAVPEELQAVLDQLNDCADRDPATVCPLPVEQQPGGGDPVACDSTNPETCGQCFTDCTDQDVTTACPLPVEGDPGVPGELQEVLDQLNACADGDPATACLLPIEG